MKGTWQRRALALATAASMLFGMFSVNSFAITGEQVAKDKTYTGTGRVENTTGHPWNGYGISLSMTVENGKISKVECRGEEDMESDNTIFLMAATTVLKGLEGKPAKLSSVESLRVDGVSNATRTATAGKEIALDLLKKAEAAETPEPEAPSENDEDLLYGTIDLPYADFYYGEVNMLTESKQELKLTAQDPAAPLRAAGMYDSVSSATKNKAKQFPTTYYEENDKTVEILGVKGVNVAISRGLYRKAKQAIKDGSPCNNHLLLLVKAMKMNEANAPAPKEYKILNGDGTLTAMNSESDWDYTARASVSTESPWGHYLITVDSKKLPSKDELEGIVVMTADGRYYGMEHLENIWLKTGEFSFAVKDGFVEPHGNKIDYLRHRELEGKTIREIRYMIRGKDDLVISFPVKCKKLTDAKLVAGDAKFKAGAKVEPVLQQAPEDSNYELKKVFKGRELLKKGEDYDVEGASIVFRDTAKTGIGQYKIVYEDKTYADLSAYFILSSAHENGSVKLKNNRLELPEDLSFATYAASIAEVKLDGKRVKGRNLMKVLFKENGEIDFRAELEGKGGKKTRLFTKGSGASYELELISHGYPSAKGTLHGPTGSVVLKSLGSNLPGYALPSYVYEAYDISLQTPDGEAIQPQEGKPVKVSLTLKSCKTDGLTIFHDKGDHQLQEIKSFKVIDEKRVEFETDHFSTFLFANKKAEPQGVGEENVKVKGKKASPKTGDAIAAVRFLFSLIGAAALLAAMNGLKRKARKRMK